MEEEKKGPTLEELYASPASTDRAPSERPEKKRSVGLTMELVFSIVAIAGAILSVVSNPDVWEFFGQPTGLDTTFWKVGVPLALLSVLITWLLPFSPFPSESSRPLSRRSEKRL